MKNKKSIPFLFFLSSAVFSLSLVALSLKKHQKCILLLSRISTFVRKALASLTNIFPYSLFESLVIFSPLIILFSVGLFVFGKDNRYVLTRRFLNFIGVFMCIASLYIFTVAIPYASKDADILKEKKSKLTLNTLLVTSDRLVDKLNLILDKTGSNECVSELVFKRTGESFGKLNGVKIYPLIKGAVFSKVLSKMNILAFYSPITGEIIINREIPEYLIPFTEAHEIAHYLGVSCEAEANFLAFKLLYSSDCHLYSYSACLVALEYLMREIFIIDDCAYYAFLKKLPRTARDDILLYSEFSRRNSGTFIFNASEKVSDAHLKVWNERGKESYSDLSYLVCEYISPELL